MDLLVSVSDAFEAVAAREGGADVIDAKNPAAGALGAVSIRTLQAIHTAVDFIRPVTAALGDASNERQIRREAQAFASTGARFVKVGFASVRHEARAQRLLSAAVDGASEAGTSCGVVGVAYADAERVLSLPPAAAIDVAARAGAAGVLLDTADKDGPGLTGLLDAAALTAWVERAHDAGLLVALAGRLSVDDMPLVLDTGADIAGVRGAACEGGRLGHITALRVRQLKQRLATPGRAARATRLGTDEPGRVAPACR
jgi:hypothetical protein